MHSHIGYICFEFSSVHVFKYVLNPLGSEQACSHWLHLFDFFHCVLSSVSSNCRPKRIRRRTGCICSYLRCVFKNESSNVIYRENIESNFMILEFFFNLYFWIISTYIFNMESHWLHMFDFSPLCVFKCLLKALAW